MARRGTATGRAQRERAARQQRARGAARPAQGQNLDVAQIAQTGRDQAAQNINFLGQQLGGLTDNFASQQQRQIDAQAQRLDNQYTADARGQINQSLNAAGQIDSIGNNAVSYGATVGQQINNLAPLAQQQANAAAGNINALAPEVIGIGDQYMGQIGGLGNMLGDQARQAFAQSGPTEIEQELYRQGQADLALGRSLSAEEMRDATQSARQGMAARGMATGMASLGAELLNRNRFATQREAERRSFAADANNLREKNVMDRRDVAGRLAEAGGRTMDVAGRMGIAGRDTAGRLYDTAGRLGVLGTSTAAETLGLGARTTMSGQEVGGRLLADAGRLRQTGAGMMADLDPYARAMNPGMSMGQSAMGAAGNFIGNNLTGMTDLAGNVSSYNTNRQDSLYNSWMNNQTALRVGQMQADAMNNAARMQANAYGGLAGAQRQAGTMGMIGGIGQGILGGALSLFGR